MCFGEERQKIRSAYLCACGTMGRQALGNLLDPFLRLSLMCQRPATQDSTNGYPVRKALFLRKAHGGFGVFLGPPCLVAQLMDLGNTAQGKTHAIRVRALLR